MIKFVLGYKQKNANSYSYEHSVSRKRQIITFVLGLQAEKC